MAELSHVHRFEPASRPDRPGRPTLLLLHGTGGDENDLVPLVEMVSPGSGFVSPRGKVLENGMPRFFRRLAEGVLDEDDVRRRANELADFIAEAREAYDLPAPIALGFSNGANVAAAVMLLRPDALAGAVLMRAMVPLAEPPAARLDGAPVLILSGAADPLVPADNAARLAVMLEEAGAAVRHEIVSAGHNLSQTDVTLAHAWLEER
jgi:phospholipase/carboxylesterase